MGTVIFQWWNCLYYINRKCVMCVKTKLDTCINFGPNRKMTLVFSRASICKNGSLQTFRVACAVKLFLCMNSWVGGLWNIQIHFNFYFIILKNLLILNGIHAPINPNKIPSAGHTAWWNLHQIISQSVISPQTLAWKDFLCITLPSVLLSLVQSPLCCLTIHTGTICSKMTLWVFDGGLWVVSGHPHHPLPFWYFSWPATSGLKRNGACGLPFPHCAPHNGNWQLNSLRSFP